MDNPFFLPRHTHVFFGLCNRLSCALLLCNRVRVSRSNDKLYDFTSIFFFFKYLLWKT